MDVHERGEGIPTLQQLHFGVQFISFFFSLKHVEIFQASCGLSLGAVVPANTFIGSNCQLWSNSKNLLGQNPGVRDKEQVSFHRDARKSNGVNCLSMKILGSVDFSRSGAVPPDPMMAAKLTDEKRKLKDIYSRNPYVANQPDDPTKAPIFTFKDPNLKDIFWSWNIIETITETTRDWVNMFYICPNSQEIKLD